MKCRRNGTTLQSDNVVVWSRIVMVMKTSSHPMVSDTVFSRTELMRGRDVQENNITKESISIIIFVGCNVICILLYSITKSSLISIFYFRNVRHSCKR